MFKPGDVVRLATLEEFHEYGQYLYDQFGDNTQEYLLRCYGNENFIINRLKRANTFVYLYFRNVGGLAEITGYDYRRFVLVNTDINTDGLIDLL